MYFYKHHLQSQHKLRKSFIYSCWRAKATNTNKRENTFEFDSCYIIIADFLQQSFPTIISTRKTNTPKLNPAHKKTNAPFIWLRSLSGAILSAWSFFLSDKRQRLCSIEARFSAYWIRPDWCNNRRLPMKYHINYIQFRFKVELNNNFTRNRFLWLWDCFSGRWTSAGDWRKFSRPE